jgi:hypothetical protein
MVGGWAAALMLGLWGAAAPAERLPPAPAPAYEVGDAFVFSDGRVEQVRRIDGEVISWAGLKGAPYQRSRSFFLPVLGWSLPQGEGRRTVTGHPEALWPLAPGRSVRFSVVTETRRAANAPWARNLSLWTCTVAPTRQVTVGAGAFQVLPIACDRYSPSTMRLLERITWEYSDELGHYVRRTTIDYVSARTTVIQLSSALHGPAATRARLAALAAQATASSRP